MVYRSAYRRNFILRLANRLRERSEALERWVVFDNTAEGQAIPNALALLEVLSQ